LDEALDCLRCRLQELRPDMDISSEIDDDEELDSTVSSTMNALNAPHRFARAVRFGPSPREMDLLKKKLSEMEQENKPSMVTLVLFRAKKRRMMTIKIPLPVYDRKVTS
jgi:hypothetical protein